MSCSETTSDSTSHVRGLSRDAAKARTAQGSAHSREEGGGRSYRQAVWPGSVHLPATGVSGQSNSRQEVAEGAGDGSPTRDYARARGQARGDITSVLSLVGLALKAGKLMLGDQACRKALALGQGRLVILADDASERTRRTFLELAQTTGVPACYLGRKTQLGQRLGREQVAVLVVTDVSLAQAIKKALAGDEKLRG